ncbi:ABC transporter permease [Myroides ceti]|uniref:ABC transporter permease n=1 Tax=Paenimyroides ceti TaxID=395087 RepID=A0ABT8D055_9FLAO|nr:ABC transporter permease [Paenimyroides ceti]MDN3708609.1 ABC transporter permease [Paenimyroides ceti]
MNVFQNQDITRIARYLPHCQPMLMVDIIDYIDDENVDTSFEIKPSTLFVENDFFTEAGLIENAAQTCSAIVGQHYFFDDNKQEIENVKVVGFISAIKKIEIFSLPKVHTVIKTKAKLDSKFMSDDYQICTLQIEIFNDNELTLRGIMNLFLQKTTDEKI